MTHELWAGLCSGRILTLIGISQAADIFHYNYTRANCGPQVQHFQMWWFCASCTSVSSCGRFTQDRSCCHEFIREDCSYRERKAKYLTGRATSPYNVNWYPLILIHINPHWVLLGTKSAKFSQHARTSLQHWFRKMEPHVCHCLTYKHCCDFYLGQSTHTHWVL